MSVANKPSFKNILFGNLNTSLIIFFFSLTIATEPSHDPKTGRSTSDPTQAKNLSAANLPKSLDARKSFQILQIEQNTNKLTKIQ
jgi:hypothetical protein